MFMGQVEYSFNNNSVENSSTKVQNRKSKGVDLKSILLVPRPDWVLLNSYCCIFTATQKKSYLIWKKNFARFPKQKMN